MGEGGRKREKVRERGRERKEKEKERAGGRVGGREGGREGEKYSDNLCTITIMHLFAWQQSSYHYTVKQLPGSQLNPQPKQTVWRYM